MTSSSKTSIEKQELLQKKVRGGREAARPRTSDGPNWRSWPASRRRLEREARDLAQKLTRNQGERAAEELKRAAREMAQAREQMENGDPAGDKMTDALERLDEAQAELDQARQKNEEELVREQAAKFADEIKALRDRMQRLTEEAGRIHGIVKKAGKWERPVRTSLNDLRQQQQGLAGEVRGAVGEEVPERRRLRPDAPAVGRRDGPGGEAHGQPAGGGRGRPVRSGAGGHRRRRHPGANRSSRSSGSTSCSTP